jgi:hypothetical protein
MLRPPPKGLLGKKKTSTFPEMPQLLGGKKDPSKNNHCSNDVSECRPKIIGMQNHLSIPT